MRWNQCYMFEWFLQEISVLKRWRPSWKLTNENWHRPWKVITNLENPTRRNYVNDWQRNVGNVRKSYAASTLQRWGNGWLTHGLRSFWGPIQYKDVDGLPYIRGAFYIRGLTVGQYHICWWSSSLCLQVIKSHDIRYIRQAGSHLPWEWISGRLSSTLRMNFRQALIYLENEFQAGSHLPWEWISMALKCPLPDQCWGIIQVTKKSLSAWKSWAM